MLAQFIQTLDSHTRGTASGMTESVDPPRTEVQYVMSVSVGDLSAAKEGDTVETPRKILCNNEDI